MISTANQNETNFIISASMLENQNGKFIRVIGFRTCPSIIGTRATVRTFGHTRTAFMVLVKGCGTFNDTIRSFVGRP